MISTRRAYPIALVVFALITVATVLHAQQRAFTAADHVRLEFPTSLAISPDGAKIAYVVQHQDLDKSASVSEIYLLNVADKSVRQLTYSPVSCSSPAWSPDGRWLTFVSSRPFLDSAIQTHSGSPQLFALPMTGGEAVPWTTLSNGVDEYAWSPDGSMIAILSEQEESKEKQEADEAAKKHKMDWNSSLEVKPGKTLWMLDVKSGSVRQVADLDRGAESFAWSPDNKRLVYQTNYTGEYNDEQKYDLWTIDLSGTKTQLTNVKGPETHPLYSPDGRSIAYVTQTVPDIEFAKTEISIMDANGSNVRNLTHDFTYSVNDFAWMPDGKSLVARISEGVHGYFYTVGVKDGAMRKLTDGDIVLDQMTVSRSGVIACGVETPTTLREIALLRKGNVEPLTDFSKQIAGYDLGTQEVIHVKTRDGKYTIDALLVKPAGYVAGKKYPLLLAYHGGPYGDYENRFYQYYPVRLLAQEGVMSVMPNVRGSSGYSDEFAQSNRYDLGGGDFRDAMDVVDYLIAQGLVDSTKMGVMGGSYGGYMTNWTISQTPRFKSAVSMFGIFSWFTDWSNSFQPSFEQMYFGYNYWERPLDIDNLWIRTAPQTYVQNIVTPTLILHGTADVYTNISNSREMYQALHELGRTVEFVIYPRAQHGLRTEPNQYINVLERSMKWFEKYALDKK